MRNCDECRACQDHCVCAQFGGPEHIYQDDQPCFECETEAVEQGSDNTQLT